MPPTPIPVLIVDDNRNYREAFARNLEMMDFEVAEAEDGDEAIRLLEERGPMVMVTDLQMRTDTEGLDLIREARALHPLLPVIMISAVGTFEEGALASEYGACHVIHKSRIEEEIEPLYESIVRAHREYRRNQLLRDRIERLRASEDDAAAALALQDILMKPDVDLLVKGEAYDLLMNLQSAQMRSAAEDQIAGLAAGGAPALTLEELIRQLREMLPFYDSLHDGSKESLHSAEFLYYQQSRDAESFDFSRNIGFSYCFAVENEVKAVLKRKLTRFLNEDQTYRLIKSFLDQKQHGLDLAYHQFLLKQLHAKNMDVTTDNAKQIFLRVLQHQKRYKPDGLKAVGILIFCFGRHYTFRRESRNVEIRNPLNLKIGDGDEEQLELLAQNLIGLQHHRNPYIHPEISEPHKISKVREIAMECLHLMKKLV